MIHKIVDRRTNAVLPATVRTNVTKEELIEVQQRWRTHKVGSLLLQSGVSGLVPEHDWWDWPTKYADSDPDFHRFFSLVHDNEVEGLMMLSTTPIPSKIPGRSHEDVLYIEYIESAPWNLEYYNGSNIQYKGIGSALLAAAVATSEASGCGGRLALKSLRDAEGFYRRLGFISTGIDPLEQLTCFELPTHIAT